MTTDTDKTNVNLSAVRCKLQPTTCKRVDDDHVVIYSKGEPQQTKDNGQ